MGKVRVLYPAGSTLTVEMKKYRADLVETRPVYRYQVSDDQ
jgi:hypothetical protein